MHTLPAPLPADKSDLLLRRSLSWPNLGLVNVSRLLVISLSATCLLLGLAAAPAEDANPNQALVDGALKDFENKKFDDALKKLTEAEKSDPHSSFIQNLLGAAYTKKKDYAAAKKCFQTALDADPNFFPAQFNVGELLFLQKQYPQALAYFAKMLSNDPSNELLQFKVILCLLLTDQMDDARKEASRMRYPGDGPAWYYSQAAIEIQAGHKSKAADYLATARQIFPDKISLFDETFEDLGWPTR